MSQDMRAAFRLPESTGELIAPKWPAPPNVRAFMSTRAGGVSTGIFASMNVGAHVGDSPEAVLQNRRRIARHAPVELAYLEQVHGDRVVRATEALAALQQGQPLRADAVIDDTAQAACAIMTADCLPVLLCNDAGTVVAAAHAGWRGLAAGVLGKTVTAMNTSSIMAWLGPAIGPEAFEVGAEVKEIFCAQWAAQAAFEPIGADKFLMDIYAVARLALHAAGVTQITGGEHCTVLERERFFSYRRDGQTGRMVAAIWLNS